MTWNMRRSAVAVVAAGILAATAGCSSGGTADAGDTGALPKANKQQLTLMFGSSGPAETKAVQSAVAAFTRSSGIKVKVVPASNLVQQVAQGFAGNQPPDVFYLDTSSFQGYAAKNALYPYAQRLPNAKDYYAAAKRSFSYHGKFVCAPKDVSSLSLYVNRADWKAAGLTAADVPKNWAQLKRVAGKLTTGGRTGLVLDSTHSGLDEFLYQNGGTVLNSDGTKVELNSKRNVEALTYLKQLQASKAMQFPAQLSAGWSGEAFGKNKAAMAITGNWVTGAMSADYPDVQYDVYELPAGPTGTKATLSFSNCWGVPRMSKNLGGAVDLVKFMTTQSQQLTFAKAFGPMPSLATAQAAYTKQFPQMHAAVAGMAYAHPDIAVAGADRAVGAFDSDLAQLAKKDPKAILRSAQTNLQAVVDQAQQQK